MLARSSFVAAALMALMSVSSAQQDLTQPTDWGGMVCEVLPTSDGFAALRERPNVSAPMIRRMPTSHGVQIRFRRPYVPMTSGGWVQVVHWPDGTFPAEGDPSFRDGRIGWVARRLVGECG